MHHRTLIVVAALVGVLTPGLARAGEKLADLVAQVGTLRAAKDYASAATLAAEGAAREDLTDAARVVLGGLRVRASRCLIRQAARSPSCAASRR